MPGSAVVRLLLTLGLTVLAGCPLIDQRTFERAGLFPAAQQLHAGDYAASARPPPPLVTIRFGVPGDNDWGPSLLEAARAAQIRKPDVQFDVVTPIPVSATFAVQNAAGKTGAADASAVATALQADGISADAIHIGSRSDPGNPPRQVEIYVR